MEYIHLNPVKAGLVGRAEAWRWTSAWFGGWWRDSEDLRNRQSGDWRSRRWGTLNEAETRAERIDPALKAAWWGVVEGSRVLPEYPITLGRIEEHGRRGKPLIADYVLVCRNRKLAVIEAKAWDESLTEGVAQAKNYADKLAIRDSHPTHSRDIYRIDRKEGKEGVLCACIWTGCDCGWLVANTCTILQAKYVRKCLPPGNLSTP